MGFNIKSHTIGFIGGDKRISMLAAIMKKHNYNIRATGLLCDDVLSDEELCESARELFSVCDVIVLPVPVSRDKTNIFAEKQGFELKLCDILAIAKGCDKKIIFGGVMPKDFALQLNEYNHIAIDLFNNSDLIYSNAIVSAEGALMVSMERTESSVISTKYGVLGYGRIASYLAKILSALNGEVTVFARRDAALDEASRMGYRTFKLRDDLDEDYVQELSAELDNLSVIFNTVPSNIIKAEIIRNMNSRPLYIELASYPYGIDSRDAREANFNIIYAPSLPGRYCPMSAAEYIFKAISAYLSEI